jgi:hypothetical protein
MLAWQHLCRTHPRTPGACVPACLRDCRRQPRRRCCQQMRCCCGWRAVAQLRRSPCQLALLLLLLLLPVLLPVLLPPAARAPRRLRQRLALAVRLHQLLLPPAPAHCLACRASRPGSPAGHLVLRAAAARQRLAAPVVGCRRCMTCWLSSWTWCPAGAGWRPWGCASCSCRCGHVGAEEGAVCRACARPWLAAAANTDTLPLRRHTATLRNGRVTRPCAAPCGQGRL